MISAFFDVLRPFLSLCFIAFMIYVLAVAVDIYADWRDQKHRDRRARRMFEGNHQPNHPPLGERRAAPHPTENVRKLA